MRASERSHVFTAAARIVSKFLPSVSQSTLARAFAMGNPLVRDGQRVVDALRDKLGESSSLAMFDSRSAHAKVVYVCRAETARIISVPLFSVSSLPSPKRPVAIRRTIESAP